MDSITGSDITEAPIYVSRGTTLPAHALANAQPNVNGELVIQATYQVQNAQKNVTSVPTTAPLVITDVTNNTTIDASNVASGTGNDVEIMSRDADGGKITLQTMPGAANDSITVPAAGSSSATGANPQMPINEVIRHAKALQKQTQLNPTMAKILELCEEANNCLS